MISETRRTCLLGAAAFAGLYLLYALTTRDYVEVLSAQRPQLWTLYRLVTVSCALTIGVAICLGTKKPLRVESYAIASLTGGAWLLFMPFWHGSHSDTHPGLAIGAALNYAIISGFYGAWATKWWLAALMGVAALAAQVNLDIVGYLAIVGYRGFH